MALRSPIRRCVAASGATVTAKAAAGDSVQASGTKAAAVTVMPWQRVPWRPWHLRLPPTAQQLVCAEPEAYVHGSTLGPCPLVVLGGAGDGTTALADHAAWLSHCNLRHGALGVPMPTLAAFATARTAAAAAAADATTTGSSEPAAGLADTSYVTAQCHAVARMLDLLGVNWAHFVTHSVGALVAAKMAWLYPEKVGTIALLDTPLLTKEWLRNEELRAEFVRASLDVNTPDALLRATQQQLRDAREGPPPCGAQPSATATASSGEVYAREIFPEEQIFADGGAARSDAAHFMSAAHVQQMRHPVLLVSPKAGAVADAALHKQRLNLRKHSVIASAESHEALFLSAAPKGGGSGGGAAELGAAVAQWHDRFDADAIMRRKWDASVRDMRPKKTAADGSTEAADGAKPPQQQQAGKKKDKKKKGGGGGK